MIRPLIGHQIIHLESVDSTNNYAAKVFKSDEVGPGAVILADIQKNGRGQRDKTWQSDAFENLTFSFTAAINLWKINSLMDLNRIVALSLYELFKEIGLEPKIKWPNDIMINDKKISGILIENFFRGEKAKTIVGIGINVNQQQFSIPRATSISIEKKEFFKTRELLDLYLSILNKLIPHYSTLRAEDLQRLYDQQLWLRNEEIRFTTRNNEKKHGRIIGTTLDGKLLVNLDGKTISVRNGEVKY